MPLDFYQCILRSIAFVNMNKLYNHVISEILGISVIKTIGNLFTADKYISKCSARYVRKIGKNEFGEIEEFDELCCSNIYYMKHYSKVAQIYDGDVVFLATNTRVLKFLLSSGYKFNIHVMPTAAYQGNLEIIKIFLQNGYKLDSSVLTAAIGFGDLHNLKWLRENGCPLSSDSWIKAIESENIEIMEWLKSIGCPFQVFDTFYYARGRNKSVAITWLINNGCPNSRV